LVVGILLTSTCAWGQDNSALGEAQVISQAMVEAVRKAEPAVASIFVSRSEDYRRLLKDSPPPDQPGELGAFDRDQAKKILADTFKDSHRLDTELRKLDLRDPEHVPESYGSGVVISAQGLVLSNFHVVRDAAKIYVRLPGGKGSYANIHAGDGRSDLAVLRLLDPTLVPLAFIQPGGRPVSKGQLILTLANPFAPGFRDARPRAGWGMVSNLRQKNPRRPTREEQVQWALHDFGTLIQTDRSLPIGCSGGALLNLQGELVGLITSLPGTTGEGGGAYAVPLNAALCSIIRVLEKGEEVEYGFLGVQFDRDPPRSAGVVFRQMLGGSPAKKAGLEFGDVIMAVDDTPVHETDDLILAINSALAGSTVRLKIRRGYNTEIVPVTLAKFSWTGPAIISVKHPFVRGMRVDYTSILAQPQRGPGQEIPSGVYVREVQKGSPAEAAKLQDAIITKVNDQDVNTPTEFYERMPRTGRVELTLVGESGQTPKVKLD
jgi:serine protease Do